MGKSFFNGFFSGFVVAVFTVAVFTLVFKGVVSTAVRADLSEALTKMEELQPQQQRYFATSTNGKLVQLKPLDEPELSRVAIVNWLNESLMSSFTFGFHDYQRRHKEAEALYSDEGWANYQGILKRHNLMERITGNNSVVTGVLQSSPTMMQEGVLDGKWRAVFKVPLLLMERTGRHKKTEELAATVTIERADLSVNPMGLQIVKIVAP